MYRGEYKSVAPNGLPYYYAAGDTVLYQGRIYEVVNPTPKSPFQSPKDWKFVGVSEPYQDALSPFEPVENQFWVDANKTLFIRAYTGTGYIWQSLRGTTTSGSSGSGITSYVFSVNGETGAVINIAKTNINNNFTDSQTISSSSGSLFIEDTTTSNYISLDPASGTIASYIDNLGLGTPVSLVFPTVTGIGKTITVPADTTILAGLALTQTFTGTNTFTQRTNFNAGISSAGGTFSSLTRFTSGISSAGATFSRNISAPNMVDSLKSWFFL